MQNFELKEQLSSAEHSLKSNTFCIPEWQFTTVYYSKLYFYMFYTQNFITRKDTQDFTTRKVFVKLDFCVLYNHVVITNDVSFMFYSHAIS